MSSALPVCVQYVQAFGGPFIAAMAAIATVTIAVAQYAVARDRYDLDIFTQRWNALEKIKACYAGVESDDFQSLAEKFEAGKHVLPILFDRKIAAIADDLVEAARILNEKHTSLVRLVNAPTAGPGTLKIIEELTKEKRRAKDRLGYLYWALEAHTDKLFVSIGPRGSKNWPPVWMSMSFVGLFGAPLIVMIWDRCLQ